MGSGGFAARNLGWGVEKLEMGPGAQAEHIGGGGDGWKWARITERAYWGWGVEVGPDSSDGCRWARGRPEREHTGSGPGGAGRAHVLCRSSSPALAKRGQGQALAFLGLW